MRTLFITTILLLAAIAASAQSPSRLMKNAERGLGGSRVLKNLNTWEMFGTIQRRTDGATGRFVMRASRPTLFNFYYEIGGFEYEWGYNGRSGWARDSRSGLRTLTGDESTDFQALANYRNNLWLNAKQERVRIVSAGANSISISTSKGAGIKISFSSPGSLPASEEFSLGDEVHRFDYSDYRPVNGIQRPHSIRMSIDDEDFELSVENSRVNGSVDRSSFDFPRLSSEPLPDIPVLLTELQQNEDSVETILDTYSYIQKSTRRQLGKDGVLREVESETYQLSFYKGNRIRRLIEKNGRPLSQRDQEKEDRDIEKRVAEIERQIAREEARNPAGPPSENSGRVSIAEVLRASRLINPRRERFRGRDVIVFDFEPDPSFDFRNAKSMLKFFGKVAGVMWIDEKDKQVARLEAYLADSFNIGGGLLAKLRKGASFTLEQERVNDEIWLPSVADINLSVRVLLVRGVNVNQVVRSYDYRKYSTEVKDASVGNPDQ